MMLTDIRTALTRKFGPLPAWAWLTITAAAVYFYRSRNGGGTAAAAAATSDATPADPSTPQDPVTLGPGESVYNPNTGQLIGTSPEQQPTTDPTDSTPIVAGPGESIYDPRTGTYYPGQPEAADNVDTPVSSGDPGVAAKAKPSALDRAKAAVMTGKIGPVNKQRLRRAGYSDTQIAYHAKRKTALATPQSKKKAKPKAQHTPPAPVKHHTTTKPRSRSGATVKHPTPRPKTTHHAPAARPRPKPTPAPKAARPRPAAAPRPVTRQRPAPAHTTPRKKKK